MDNDICCVKANMEIICAKRKLWGWGRGGVRAARKIVFHGIN